MALDYVINPNQKQIITKNTEISSTEAIHTITQIAKTPRIDLDIDPTHSCRFNVWSTTNRKFSLSGYVVIGQQTNTLQWRHNESDGVSNYQRLDCFLIPFFRHRWKKKSFTQPFIQTQIKENIKAPRPWPLWGEATGHRWIPIAKGQ